jgi:NADP-dependent 3-hydroxy acid dehydrogenase YdfG
MIMAQRVALVTGAAAGIGAACAKRLARDGIAIGVLDLDAERCAETVAAIIANRGDAIALGADISNRDQVKAAVAKLREAFGAITIVVNNAGVTDFTPFEEITEDLWNFVYRINVLGQIIVTQEVLPDMKAAHWGRIVNISSSSAQTGAINMATYSSSKGAIVPDAHLGARTRPARHHGEQHPAGLGDGDDHVRSKSRQVPDPERSAARGPSGTADGRAERHRQCLRLAVPRRHRLRHRADDRR